MINFEDDLLKKIADNDSALSYYKYEYEKSLHKYNIQEVEDKIVKVIKDIEDIEDKAYYLCKNYKNKKVIAKLFEFNNIVKEYTVMILEKNNIDENVFIELMKGDENND